ncbi:alpha/beta fold hydrolase [Enterococcus sp. AZ072]|uniref:alpha/beta fold hydrolase n=1 Tax=unclassified Enterococcus TaxID=2608891 RepID=UPI003D2D304A
MNTFSDITDKIGSFLDTHEYESIKLSNAIFTYLLCGKGNSTLVFLDGGLGTSEIWFEYIDYFENDYQVLTFVFPANLNTNTKQVVAIHELLEFLTIEKPVFIGASYGALLAQLFTKQFPEEVGGLVLISGGGMTTVTKVELKKLKIPFHLAVVIAKILPFGFVRKSIVKESIKNMTNNENIENQQIIAETMNTLYGDLSKESLINMGNLLPDIFDSTVCTSEDFDSLAGKVLLIFPEKDFFPKASQESLLQLMTNSEVIWIKDGSHGDPMFSKEYMEIVSRFLKNR